MVTVLSYIFTFAAGGILTLFVHCCLIIAKENDKINEKYANGFEEGKEYEIEDFPFEDEETNENNESDKIDK